VAQRFIISLSLLLVHLPVGAQNPHVIDSIQLVIETAIEDTSVCDAYISWGEEVYLDNPDTALILWTNTHDLAKKNLLLIPSDEEKLTVLKRRFLKLLASALSNMGYLYNNRGDISKCLDCSLQSLKIQREIGDHYGEATSLNNIGAIYMSQGNIAKGLEYFHMCLKIDEVQGNKEGQGTSLNNIGLIYVNQGDLKIGLEYLTKSFEIEKGLGNKKGMAGSYNNIGIMYERHGDPSCVASSEECRSQSIKKGLEYYFKAFKLREELGDKYGMASTLANIAGLYNLRGDPEYEVSEDMYRKSGREKGLIYYHQSLKISEEIGDRRGESQCLNHIGGIYLRGGDIQRAKEIAKRSFQLSKEIGYPSSIKSASALLYDVYKAEGNYQHALENYEIYIQMRDSIKNEKTQKATIRQQTKYEFEKAQLVKEQEEKEVARVLAEETSRRDNLQYSVILLGLLVLGSLILGLGKLSLPVRMAEGIIFFSFLILFEFILVLADPYIEGWSGGAPGIKLLFNAGIAALIFPAHAFFETRLKGRLVKTS